MIFSTTKQERKILGYLAILLVLGWLGYWLF
jgi:hypothetical protein